MDSSVSPKGGIWFLRVCHHISNKVYQLSALHTAQEISQKCVKAPLVSSCPQLSWLPVHSHLRLSFVHILSGTVLGAPNIRIACGLRPAGLLLWEEIAAVATLVVRGAGALM
jgi:hypothetical protein